MIALLPEKESNRTALVFCKVQKLNKHLKFSVFGKNYPMNLPFYPEFFISWRQSEKDEQDIPLFFIQLGESGHIVFDTEPPDRYIDHNSLFSPSVGR